MDIKQEDLIRFWTWCGLVEQETGSWYENKIGGKYISVTMPTLTLDHIYKFAIPKLQDNDYLITLNSWANRTWRATIKHPYRKGFYNDAHTPTEALYNAIMKVIDNEVK